LPQESHNKIIDLEKRGPVVKVTIGLSNVEAVARESVGQAVPKLIECYALIDTGAYYFGAVNKSLIRKLGIEPRDAKGFYFGSSNDSIICDIYYLSLDFPEMDISKRPRFPGDNFLALDLDKQGFDILLGLDFLSHCKFEYDGFKKSYKLTVYD
jgi:hypothetical protein